MSRWFSRSSRVTDQYVPRSECDRWNHQRPPTRHKTPAPNGQGRSGYSANENAGEPMWEVLSRYLRDKKIVKPRKLNVPRLVGVSGNLGIA